MICIGYSGLIRYTRLGIHSRALFSGFVREIDHCSALIYRRLRFGLARFDVFGQGREHRYSTCLPLHRFRLTWEADVGTEAVGIEYAANRASDCLLIRSLRDSDTKPGRRVLRPVHLRAFDTGNAEKVFTQRFFRHRSSESLVVVMLCVSSKDTRQRQTWQGSYRGAHKQ